MCTCTATAPAAARITNSPAIAATSSRTMCFSSSEYAACRQKKPSSSTSDQTPSREASTTATATRTSASQTAARSEQLAARDRAEPFDRVAPVELDVPQVVEQVRRARGRAVRDEDDERLDPLLPHRRSRRRRRCRRRRAGSSSTASAAWRWQPRVPGCGQAGARVPREPPRTRMLDARGPERGRDRQDQLGNGCLRPTRRRARGGRPSASASSRAIASPSPVPPPSRERSREKNGPEDPLALLGPDPRAGVARRARRPSRCPTTGPGRRARRRASTGTRSRAGWR